MYQQLVVFKRLHNHTDIPQHYAKDVPLGRWVDRQRVLRRDEKLEEKREFLLNSIRFEWVTGNKKNVRWKEMYERLVACKKAHETTKVPQNYEADPQLGHWVVNQRSLKKANSMTAERSRLLDSIDFAWDLQSETETKTKKAKGSVSIFDYVDFADFEQREEISAVAGNFEKKTTIKSHTTVFDGKWMTMYKRLIAYKLKHGHCLVPQKDRKDIQLGCWVGRQRANYMDGRLTDERSHLLNSLDFCWQANPRKKKRQCVPYAENSKWYDIYERLVAYKEKHKDTIVPSHYSPDPQLGFWVNRQRRMHSSKKLTEDRARLLNDIGFVWSLEEK